MSGMFEINDDDPIKPDDRVNQIIELMKSKPGITRAEMAEILGCSESTVKRTISNMVS